MKNKTLIKTLNCFEVNKEVVNNIRKNDFIFSNSCCYNIYLEIYRINSNYLTQLNLMKIY